MPKTSKNAPVPTIEDLRHRPSLATREAMRLTGWGSETIAKLCEDGELRFYWQGQTRRIITRSIFDYEDRKSQGRGST